MDAAAGPKAPRTGQRAASLSGREAAAERKPRTRKAQACQVKGQRASWKCGATSCRHGASSRGAWLHHGFCWGSAPDAVTQQVPTVLGEVARRQSPPCCQEVGRTDYQVFSLQSSRDRVATQVQRDANGLHALAGSPNRPSLTLEPKWLEPKWLLEPKCLPFSSSFSLLPSFPPSLLPFCFFRTPLLRPSTPRSQCSSPKSRQQTTRKPKVQATDYGGRRLG